MIRCRKKDTGDVRRLLELYRDFYVKTFNEEFTEAAVKEFLKIMEKFNNGKDAIFVATENSMALGAVIVVHGRKGSARIWGLAVLPDYRKTDSAGKLLDKALAFCKEKGYLKLIITQYSVDDLYKRTYLGKGFVLREQERLFKYGMHLTRDYYYR